MTEGRNEAVVTACFGTVTARLQRLFCRLPKSRSDSEKPEALQSSKAPLVQGKFQAFQIGSSRQACGRPFHEQGKLASFEAWYYSELCTIHPLESPETRFLCSHLPDLDITA